MGGKKKLSLRQIQKQQRKEKKTKPKPSSGKPAEKRKGEIFMPNPKSGEVISALKKMRVITPYVVASKFDIRMSVAKDLLRQLERQKIVQYVSGSKNLKIYKPAD